MGEVSSTCLYLVCSLATFAVPYGILGPHEVIRSLQPFGSSPQAQAGLILICMFA